jgi:hypothetical protein
LKVDFDKKGPDKRDLNKSHGLSGEGTMKSDILSNNLMKKVRFILYERTVMKKRKDYAWDNVSEVVGFNSLNCALYFVKELL